MIKIMHVIEKINGLFFFVVSCENEEAARETERNE